MTERGRAKAAPPGPRARGQEASPGPAQKAKEGLNWGGVTLPRVASTPGKASLGAKLGWLPKGFLWPLPGSQGQGERPIPRGLSRPRPGSRPISIRKRHETSAPSISAAGSGRLRAAGAIADRKGAELSGAAHTPRGSIPAGRSVRHHRPPVGGANEIVVGRGRHREYRRWGRFGRRGASRARQG